jgi:hypothetical protein
MIEILSIIIAIISLIVSIYTAWQTLLNRGTVIMAQPTIVFFGYDGPAGPPKIVIGTIMFSTGQRGHILESMFIKLRRSETIQTFSRWVYGNSNNARASGLYIGIEGVSENHHFLIPNDGTQYQFVSGEYELEVYGSLINHKSSLLLKRVQVSLNAEQATALNHREIDVMFNWCPEIGKYISETKKLSAFVR